LAEERDRLIIAEEAARMEVKKLPFHQMNSMASRWTNNAKLLSKYNFDTRTIHLENVREFEGLHGEKIFTLFVKVMVEFGYWNVDLSKFDIPVDIHVTELPFKMGALTLESPDVLTVSSSTHKKLMQEYWRIGVPVSYDNAIFFINTKICPNCNKCILKKLCSKKHFRRIGWSKIIVQSDSYIELRDLNW